MIIKRLVLAILRGYKRFISPGLPNACRFYPTCSSYSLQAIEKYDLMRGLFMSIKRLLRCHPLNPGGYDPVP